jgi:RNA polymerase sigma factor (sigma-70 family)
MLEVAQLSIQKDMLSSSEILTAMSSKINPEALLVFSNQSSETRRKALEKILREVGVNGNEMRSAEVRAMVSRICECIQEIDTHLNENIGFEFSSAIDQRTGDSYKVLRLENKTPTEIDWINVLNVFMNQIELDEDAQDELFVLAKSKANDSVPINRATILSIATTIDNTSMVLAGGLATACIQLVTFVEKLYNEDCEDDIYAVIAKADRSSKKNTSPTPTVDNTQARPETILKKQGILERESNVLFAEIKRLSSGIAQNIAEIKTLLPEWDTSELDTMTVVYALLKDQDYIIGFNELILENKQRLKALSTVIDIKHRKYVRCKYTLAALHFGLVHTAMKRYLRIDADMLYAQSHKDNKNPIDKMISGMNFTYREFMEYGKDIIYKHVDKWDPKKGKLSTYLMSVLIELITISRGSSTIYVPSNYFDYRNKLRKLIPELRSNPENAELTKDQIINLALTIMGLGDGVAQGLIPFYKGEFEVQSLDAPIRVSQQFHSDYNGGELVSDLRVSLIDSLPDTNTASPDECAITYGLREAFREVLSTISLRESEVIQLRFGLVDGKEQTLETVASHFNITRERVRQIESKALRKLRYPGRNAILRDWIDDQYD